MAKNVSEHTVLGDKLKEFTDKYKGYKTERGLYLDVNGNEILFKKGTGKHIYFYESDRALLRNRNIIGIHNHPNGASFSTDDIVWAGSNNYKELHAFGKEYHYIIYPRELGNWPKSQYAINLRYRNEIKKTTESYRRDISLGMTKRDAWIKNSHEIWQNLAKEFDLIYERIPV